MPRSARCIAVFSIAVLLLTSGLTCQASAPEPAAAAYVLMEADSGRVLLARNEEQRRSIASTTKIMTCLVALEHSTLTDKVASTYAKARPCILPRAKHSRWKSFSTG